jgi:hypothetical protein
LGYGVFNLTENRGILSLGISVAGKFETGMKWITGTSLYTGIVTDYGFNSMFGSDYAKKQLVEYNHTTPNRPIMNSICTLTNKASPLSFGVKLKLTFSVGYRNLLKDNRTYKAFQPYESQNDDVFFE